MLPWKSRMENNKDPLQSWPVSLSLCGQDDVFFLWNPFLPMQTSFNRNENSSRRLDSIVGVLNPLVFSTFTTRGLSFIIGRGSHLGKGRISTWSYSLRGVDMGPPAESHIWLPSTAIAFLMTDGLSPFPCLARGTHWYLQWQTDDRWWPLASSDEAQLSI